jgi:hypothetical protein
VITKIEIWGLEDYAKGITNSLPGYSPLKTYYSDSIVAVDSPTYSIKPQDDFYANSAQEITISVINDDADFWQKMFMIGDQSFPAFPNEPELSGIIVCIYDDNRFFDGILQRDGREYDFADNIMQFKAVDFMYLLKSYSGAIGVDTTLTLTTDITTHLQNAIKRIHSSTTSQVVFVDPPAATITMPPTVVFDDYAVVNSDIMANQPDSSGVVSGGSNIGNKFIGQDNDFSFYSGWNIPYTILGETRYLWLGFRIRVVDQHIYTTDYETGYYCNPPYPPYNTTPINSTGNKYMMQQIFGVDFDTGSSVYTTATGAEWWLYNFKSANSGNFIQLGAILKVQGDLSVKQLPIKAGTAFVDRLKLYLALCNWKLVITGNVFKIISGGELYGSQQQVVQIPASDIISAKIAIVSQQEYPYADGSIFNILSASSEIYESGLSQYYAAFLPLITREYGITFRSPTTLSINNIIVFQVSGIDHKIRLFELQKDDEISEIYSVKAYNIDFEV